MLFLFSFFKVKMAKGQPKDRSAGCFEGALLSGDAWGTIFLIAKSSGATRLDLKEDFGTPISIEQVLV